MVFSDKQNGRRRQGAIQLSQSIDNINEVHFPVFERWSYSNAVACHDQNITQIEH